LQYSQIRKLDRIFEHDLNILALDIGPFRDLADNVNQQNGAQDHFGHYVQQHY
jgi:hypothetical protein